MGLGELPSAEQTPGSKLSIPKPFSNLTLLRRAVAWRGDVKTLGKLHISLCQLPCLGKIFIACIFCVLKNVLVYIACISQESASTQDKVHKERYSLQNNLETRTCMCISTVWHMVISLCHFVFFSLSFLFSTLLHDVWQFVRHSYNISLAI